MINKSTPWDPLYSIGQLASKEQPLGYWALYNATTCISKCKQDYTIGNHLGGATSETLWGISSLRCSSPLVYNSNLTRHWFTILPRAQGVTT